VEECIAVNFHERESESLSPLQTTLTIHAAKRFLFPDLNFTHDGSCYLLSYGLYGRFNYTDAQYALVQSRRFAVRTKTRETLQRCCCWYVMSRYYPQHTKIDGIENLCEVH